MQHWDAKPGTARHEQTSLMNGRSCHSSPAALAIYGDLWAAFQMAAGVHGSTLAVFNATSAIAITFCSAALCIAESGRRLDSISGQEAFAVFAVDS
jgi:hypothetical protein